MAKTKWLSLILAVCIILTAAPVMAWPGYVWGKPTAFDPGDSVGYFIWRDDEGFHVRTTTRGAERHFSGSIVTDGKFTDTDLERGEAGDRYRVKRGAHKINFDLHTSGHVDGIDFKIAHGDAVTFNLFVDGKPIDAKHIYIGRRNHHPHDNSFEIENR